MYSNQYHVSDLVAWIANSAITIEGSEEILQSSQLMSGWEVSCVGLQEH